MDLCQCRSADVDLDDLRHATYVETEREAQISKVLTELRLLQGMGGGQQQHADVTARYECQLEQVRAGVDALCEHFQAVQGYRREVLDDDSDSDYDDERAECEEPRGSGRKRKRGKPRYFQGRDGYYYTHSSGVRHGLPYGVSHQGKHYRAQPRRDYIGLFKTMEAAKDAVRAYLEHHRFVAGREAVIGSCSISTEEEADGDDRSVSEDGGEGGDLLVAQAPLGSPGFGKQPTHEAGQSLQAQNITGQAGMQDSAMMLAPMDASGDALAGSLMPTCSQCDSSDGVVALGIYGNLCSTHRAELWS